MPDATRAQLLDAAQEFAQTRGYNGFSFHDLAARVGIRTASVHYYFPAKGDLGRELMARYRERFMARLAEIDARVKPARRKLARFVELFRAALAQGDRMCLCGMLATEYATLPAEVQEEVRRFFRECEAWLAKALTGGRKSRDLEFEGSPAAAARTLFAALEGAMMSARAFGDPDRLTGAGRWLIDQVAPRE